MAITRAASVEMWLRVRMVQKMLLLFRSRLIRFGNNNPKEQTKEERSVATCSFVLLFSLSLFIELIPSSKHLILNLLKKREKWKTILFCSLMNAMALYQLSRGDKFRVFPCSWASQPLNLTDATYDPFLAYAWVSVGTSLWEVQYQLVLAFTLCILKLDHRLLEFHALRLRLTHPVEALLRGFIWMSKLPLQYPVLLRQVEKSLIKLYRKSSTSMHGWYLSYPFLHQRPSCFKL